MATPRGRRPEPIGDIVRERIAALGWEGRLREERVLADWDQIVGPQIAAHARPSHIAGRRLTVVTENPVWTQQLSLLRGDLLRRIARAHGPETVAELYFVTGRIEAPPAPEAEPAALKPPAALSPALEAELEAIGDADVRESVRRLMLAAHAEPAPG